MLRAGEKGRCLDAAALSLRRDRYSLKRRTRGLNLELFCARPSGSNSTPARSTVGSRWLVPRANPRARPPSHPALLTATELPACLGPHEDNRESFVGKEKYCWSSVPEEAFDAGPPLAAGHATPPQARPPESSPCPEPAVPLNSRAES